MGTVWKVLTRKKVIDPITAEESQLARRLSTFDLTALGVGSTLGVGVYVLAGHVAKNVAGPSVILSFLIAALASVFAGLCYAEFGARAPRAGSAYIYSYVCIGEFVAFIIGWNLVLEYIIGSASVAKGLSLYLDSLINSTLQNTFIEIAPINIPFMAKYFDFFSCGISVLLAVALAFGLKESSVANNIFTTLNIAVVLFVIIAGSLKADITNWQITTDNTTNATVVGEGGFFPFGIEGTITGAATCFYGFVGFDCIATTGEEAKNPKKAIPLSIIISLSIIFLAYFGISTVVTLMVPYYLQNADAPIPYAFDHVGWNWAKWIVSIGGIFGLCASLFGAMFPLPRIIYAMASDSLVFKFLGRVSPKFQTPVVGTLLAGILTGLMAAMFELNQLVNMMSIGTLMAYTIVAASVLLLRYSETATTFDIANESTIDDNGLLNYEFSNSSAFQQFFNCGRYVEPNKISQSIVTINVFLYCITCVLIGLTAIYLKHPISNGETWAIVVASIIVFFAVVLIMSIATQPLSRKELSFKVPMLPLIPALSILVNIYLMLMLDYRTWIRFAVWMVIGLPTYYFSVRPLNEKSSDTKSMEKPVEKEYLDRSNGKLNYYTNNGFIDDYQKEIANTEIEDKVTEVIEIQQELEKFDEMLDEVASKLDTHDRSTSIGGVSVSDVSCEENVIADVHRDNVLIPAIPINPTNEPPITLQSKTEKIEVQTKASDSENDVVISDVLKDVEELPPTNFDTVKDQPTDDHVDDENNAPLTDVDIIKDSSIASKRPLSFISHSNFEPDTVEAVRFFISPTPTPPPSTNPSPLLTPKIVRTEPNTPEAPPLPPLFTSEDRDSENMNQLEKKNTSGTLPRVTVKNIKEVNLKPVKKREEDSENKFEPDDDNLKLGSEKAKNFKEKLTKITGINGVMPNYIVPIRKKGPAPPPPPPRHEKNENVIEENIDRTTAREKLGLLVNMRLSAIEPMKNAQSHSQNSIDISISEKPTEEDTANIPKFVTNKTENSGAKKETNDYLEFQDRMKGVLRSVKSLNTSKEPTPTRNVKSLDSKHDEAKQRPSLNDLFASQQPKV